MRAFSCSWFQSFFDDYVGACLLWMKINVKPIVPVEDMALVQVLSVGMCPTSQETTTTDAGPHTQNTYRASE